jgi:transposase
VKARTAQANQIRGLLSEFGLIIPVGIVNIAKHELPGAFRLLIDHLKELDAQVDEMQAQVVAWHCASAVSVRLQKTPRIGPITASALVASLGDTKNFDSGGKNVLLGMSKRGDTYLRTLLSHGARAVIRAVQAKLDKEGWLYKLLSRRNANVAAVALAKKNARTVWALLAHGRDFCADYGAQAWRRRLRS